MAQLKNKTKLKSRIIESKWRDFSIADLDQCYALLSEQQKKKVINEIVLSGGGNVFAQQIKELFFTLSAESADIKISEIESTGVLNLTILDILL